MNATIFPFGDFICVRQTMATRPGAPHIAYFAMCGFLPAIFPARNRDLRDMQLLR